MECEKFLDLLKALVLLAQFPEPSLLLREVEGYRLGLYPCALVAVAEMPVDAVAPGIESAVLGEREAVSRGDLDIFDGALRRKSYLLRIPPLIVQLSVS